MAKNKNEELSKKHQGQVDSAHLAQEIAELFYEVSTAVNRDDRGRELAQRFVKYGRRLDEIAIEVIRA